MKRSARSSLVKKLEKDHECYVLITCDKPTCDGNMHVEMSFGGDDPHLASYLLQGAKNAMDQNIEQSQEEDAPICDNELRLIK